MFTAYNLNLASPPSFLSSPSPLFSSLHSSSLLLAPSAPSLIRILMELPQVKCFGLWFAYLLKHVCVSASSVPRLWSSCPSVSAPFKEPNWGFSGSEQLWGGEPSCRCNILPSILTGFTLPEQSEGTDSYQPPLNRKTVQCALVRNTAGNGPNEDVNRGNKMVFLL